MAVTLTVSTLSRVLGLDVDEATRLLAASTELVNRYAPAAPASVGNEAVIRTAGYLAEQPRAAVRSERTGNIETSFAATHLSALRHSGAMALLSPYKIRRGGAI